MASELENLKIYQMASALELEVYKSTKSFPGDEKYRSIDQLRRSSASVTNNIAESYEKRSLKERVYIWGDIVKGEAQETKNGLMMALQKGFHDNKDVIDRYTELLKAVSGYIRFLKTNSEHSERNQ
ncbi:four helix bundle protein [Candidatus Wolfebacteria bacterium]|nr:four helix bundle protein [Candidatus Wolfebacteria bacterium]